MSTHLTLILPYILLAAGAGFLGGVLALFWSPGAKTRGAIQHFAAGAVLAAVASNVIPEVERTGTFIGIMSGFVMGGLLMIGLKWLTLRFERREKSKNKLPAGLAAAEATLAVVLSFGAAALIYLIAEELLVESIQAEKSLFSTAMLFSGFGVLLSVAPKEFIKEKPIDKIQEGIEKGYFHFLKENTRIEYLPQGHKEQFNDPEEYVRAEYYYDLLEKYRYLGRRIAFEIEMPDRTPERFADIVIYEDEARARPYIVVECKKDGISDAEFEQATKQAIAARTDFFCMNK